MTAKGRLIRIAALAAAVITLFALIGANEALAKSKAKLSTKKLSICAGKSKKLKLTGTSRKAKWYVYGDKLVTVKTKGKKRHTAVVKAGQKTGTCYIRVKAGKKTFKCKVKVYEKPFSERPISNASRDLTSLKKKGEVTGRSADESFTSGWTGAAVDIFKHLSLDTPDANVLISPDSIFTALAMAENGASGNTLTEMESFFGDIPVQDFSEYLYTLNSRLKGLEDVKYHIADSVWYKENDIHVKDEFLQKNVDYFQAQVFSSPFSAATLTDINNWVYNNTRGMIEKILEDLSKDTSMVILNALCFEGKWESPYEKYQVSPEAFKNDDGSVQKTVRMLHGTEHTFVKIHGAEGFVKNYKGGKIAFLGIETPEGKTLSQFVSELDGSDFVNGYAQRTHVQAISTKMPEFKYDYSTSLVDTLKALGIQDAFDENFADFSGITPPEEPLYISDVIHKTHIELDKDGTKAAAVTSIIMDKATSTPDDAIEVDLDRPFVYAIIDTETGLPLFIGTVKTL